MEAALLWLVLVVSTGIKIHISTAQAVKVLIGKTFIAN